MSLVGLGGLLNQLTKNVLETVLNVEVTERLGHEHGGTPLGVNMRNGTWVKMVLTGIGLYVSVVGDPATLLTHVKMPACCGSLTHLKMPVCRVWFGRGRRRCVWLCVRPGRGGGRVRAGWLGSARCFRGW